MCADQDVLEDRKLLEQCGLLKGAHQAKRGDPVRGEAGDLPAVEQNPA